ncbi:MAG: hypothetical protein HOK67_08515 [Deltaproteobacteria bacterium]|jgi:hypothetical protein|nr:hypothetical protein [Deltaproteobacteria bacterium]MBT4643503.1 hypothetical protein [Deltaproteobacteria bacterium]MBT6499935.1 hypothetical protein [Deltaproteobacteria bacterium]MBT6613570.1 hypothetical protein [Deltaproteobacteria bacterium]MBT7153394.1 hypothetical protein [Deltaproteobacteria bacterium]
MNTQEKREELIRFFRQTLLDQTEAIKEADESLKELLELQMEKTTFSLLLMEDGHTVFNGEKVELTDARIEMLYRGHIENPT